eukprot:scpid110293/ scgid27031/ 
MGPGNGKTEWISPQVLSPLTSVHEWLAVRSGSQYGTSMCTWIMCAGVIHDTICTSFSHTSTIVTVLQYLTEQYSICCIFVSFIPAQKHAGATIGIDVLGTQQLLQILALI